MKIKDTTTFKLITIDDNEKVSSTFTLSCTSTAIVNLHMHAMLSSGLTIQDTLIQQYKTKASNTGIFIPAIKIILRLVAKISNIEKQLEFDITNQLKQSVTSTIALFDMTDLTTQTTLAQRRASGSSVVLSTSNNLELVVQTHELHRLQSDALMIAIKPETRLTYIDSNIIVD